MIDLSKIEQYRENNRIEAKKALGGLPHSIWETYSAFANALGGIILLGVEEHRDKSLHVIDLPDPERLVREFWELLNNPQVASVNILSEEDVQILSFQGRRMIAITVPRAQRLEKPVYIGGNPLTGSYRRSGEGDYRCSREEVQSMFRDAGLRTQDMKLLQCMDMDAFAMESVDRYRSIMRHHRPGHIWENLSDRDFLYKLGALGRDDEGRLRPTGAGLLMFGHEYEIIREFPNYFLDYREQMSRDSRLTDRLVSSSGDWSGNIFDFYLKIYPKIVKDIKLPPDIKSGEDSPVHQALREALANSLINADYYGRQGLVIIKRRESISISNPGAFRIGIDSARRGGISDPRNAALLRMFNLVNIGHRSGSGIPGIYAAWQEQGWALPRIEESFKPERITLSLAIRRQDEDCPGKNRPLKTLSQKETVIVYLTDKISAGSAEIGKLLGLKPSRTRAILRELIQENVISAVGEGRNRVYKMKD